jgi:hypothetical protein
MRILAFAFDFIEEISRYIGQSDSRKSTFSMQRGENPVSNSKYDITAFNIFRLQRYLNNFSFEQRYKHKTLILAILPPGLFANTLFYPRVYRCDLTKHDQWSSIRFANLENVH